MPHPHALDPLEARGAAHPPTASVGLRMPSTGKMMLLLVFSQKQEMTFYAFKRHYEGIPQPS